MRLDENGDVQPIDPAEFLAQKIRESLEAAFETWPGSELNFIKGRSAAHVARDILRESLPEIIQDGFGVGAPPIPEGVISFNFANKSWELHAKRFAEYLASFMDLPQDDSDRAAWLFYRLYPGAVGNIRAVEFGESGDFAVSYLPQASFMVLNLGKGAELTITHTGADNGTP